MPRVPESYTVESASASILMVHAELPLCTSLKPPLEVDVTSSSATSTVAFHDLHAKTVGVEPTLILEKEPFSFVGILIILSPKKC
jgi:hypothetical protein